MRIHKILGITAGLAVAMLATSVARADSGGLDPRAKITVPTDPGYESCAEIIAENPANECFTSPDTVVEINAPTAEQVADDPDFSIATNFYYEPLCDSTTPSTCTPADIITTLDFYFSNSINGGKYGCTADTSIPNPAFTACAITGFISVDGVNETEGELSCAPGTVCAGMLPGEEGSALVTPEPDTLMLLGFGVPLVVLATWKRRKDLNLGRQNRTDLSPC
jgi:hypothetical protein